MSTVKRNKQSNVRRSQGQPRPVLTAWILGVAIAVLVLGFAAGPVQAESWGTPGDGVSGSADFTISYSSMWRMTPRDESSAQLETEINLDDGNRNFKDGRQVSSLLKILGEFEIRNDKPSTTVGFFARGYGFNDWAIWDQRSDHNAPARNNSGAVYQGSLSPFNDGFTPEAQDRIGRRVELLDAFLYVNAFRKTNHPMSIKLGRQVVNWGESLFIQNGILNALNPADVTRAAIPGTEIKEILFPVNQLFASVALSPSVSMSGYYQFDFQETIAPPPGAFFSSNDFIGDGAEKILLDIFEDTLPIPFPPWVPQVSTLDRTADIRPENDHGQYGLSLNWTAAGLNYTDFGFYFLNYHSKLPQLGFRSALDGIADSPAFTPELREMIGLPPVVAPWAADTSWFFHEYFDDIKLYGASFNTTLPSAWILDTAWSGEVAYHTDMPVQTIRADEGLKSMMMFGGPVPIMLPGQELHLATRQEVLTAQTTFNQKIAAPKLADDITLLSEFGFVSAPNLSNDEVFRGPYDVDNFAWGYKMKMINTWFSPLKGKLSGTDLIGVIAWSHDVDGYSVIQAGSFNGGSKALGFSLEGIWQQTFSLGLYYNFYWWDDQQLQLGDRNNAGIILKAFF